MTNPIQFYTDPDEIWVDGLSSATCTQIDDAARPVRQNVPDFRLPLADALDKEADDRARFLASMSFNGMRDRQSARDDRRKMEHCREWARVLRRA